MHLSRRALLAGLLGLAAAPALAQGVGFGLGMQDVVARAGAGPRPLDGFTQPAAAYSFRKLRTAYTGPAIRIIRDSDQAELDVGFTSAGDFNLAAAVTHCTAANCYFMTAYDQSGNGRHATQPTPGNRPYLQFNCGVAGGVCASSNWASIGLSTPVNYAGVTSNSFSTVARRMTANTGFCSFIARGLNGLRSHNVNPPANFSMQAFMGGEIVAPAPDFGWHTSSGVLNGVSSVLRVDGVEVPGNVVVDTTAGGMGFVGGDASTSCQGVEGIAWDNYSLTPAERVALENNQREYWAPFPLDRFANPAAAYSLRKLKSSYTGPAVKLRRAAGGTQDINFLGYVPGLGAPIDVAAANAFCTSSCYVDTWYDQSGNNRHAVQPAPADQPSFVFTCKDNLPCARTTGTQGTGWGAGAVPSGAQSFSVVANADTAARNCIWMAAVNNRLVAGTAWQLDNSAVGINAPASVGAWHAGNGVVNGVSSVVNVDGVEATGTVAVDATAGASYFLFGTGVNNCSETEAIWWNTYALTAGERAALRSNQQSFWGTP